MAWLEPAEFPAWRRRLDLHRRAHHLSPARRDVLLALLAELGSGHDSPTDAELAEITGYSSRTVRRARADATALGLLATTRTRRMIGGQWRQGPNIYAVQTPQDLVCAPGGQDGRARKKERLREADKPRAVQAQIAALPPPVLSLAEISARRQAAMLADWQRRRSGVSLPDHPRGTRHG